MTKRRKFVFASLVLVFLMLAPQFLIGSWKYISIFIVSLLVIPVYLWALKEAIVVREAVFLSILPVLFTLSVGLFWFLLPTSFWITVALYLFYGVGTYILFLVCNIYAVSLVRTIPLARSAKSVGFVYSLFTIFLFANFISASGINVFVASLTVAFFTFIIYTLNNWVSVMDVTHYRTILKYAAYSALIVLEVSSLLFFWPLTTTIYSLAISTLSYIIIGLGQMAMERRLFPQTITEYVRTTLLIFLGVMFSVRWR